MEKLILLGGGGHCKACIDVIEQENRYEVIGILDQPEMVGKKILNHSVIGTDDAIVQYVNDGVYFLITVGQIKSASIRRKLAAILLEHQAKLATVISPHAYVSKYATIEHGTIVMHHAVVNTAAKVGKHCILNTMALVEHDATIEDFCHISTAAIVNGGVHMKEGTFMGSNSVTKEYVTTKKNDFIKAGTVFKGEI